MNLAAALMLLAAQTAEPDPDAAKPPAPSGAPATIDSLLDQIPMSEDAREAAVKGAYAAAQARRGALDGRWRLSATDGRVLYIFQLSDPGPIPDPRSSTPSVPVIEGAWRDPSRASDDGGSGFLTSVQRDGAGLTLRFTDHERSEVVSLRQRAADDWTGTILGEAVSRPVVMARF